MDKKERKQGVSAKTGSLNEATGFNWRFNLICDFFLVFQKVEGLAKVNVIWEKRLIKLQIMKKF